MSEMLIECADRSLAGLSSDPDGDRFRIVFDAVNDGIFITEKATGEVMDVNEAGCRMFGYDKSELIGRGIGPLSSGEYPYTHELATARVVRPARQQAMTFEWHCRTKTGQLFWSEISVRHTEFENIPVAVSIVRDITGRKRLNAEIAHMAQHDALTGLANRSVFISTLERAMLHARRGDESVAILFVDLDHFKEVNAMRGHLVGDQLVRLVAKRLQNAVRFNETAFRLGGDGFAILLSDAGEPAEIAAVADRLIATISKPFQIHRSGVQIGASIGVAIGGEHSRDPDTLMSHAGTALHRAKAEGGNTYRFYSAAMDDEVRSRIALTDELRVAIPAGQLFVVYQAQVSTREGRVVGVEALVRWAHPDRGMLTPASFLDVAESSGLIVDLDRWVLRQACWQARQWIDAGVGPGKMCVNLSGLQFKQPLELERVVLAALEETGLPADTLELEITETTFIGFSSEHRTMIQRLRGAGVTFTLDDFGTGHSSLNYLRRFSVDRIKIAREFIADVAVSRDAAAIVKCILTLARELGNGVIAEGVESLEQLTLLQDWECQHIQGFYFARPMTAEAISPLLSAGTIVPARLH